MFEHIKAILSDYTNADITVESSFTGDLGLTSFDLVAIIGEFEDEYNIEIPDEDIRMLITVKDALDYLEERI